VGATDNGRYDDISQRRSENPLMRVLVAFGSKRGGTAGLARMIADALTEQGCEVLVTPARDVHDIAGVDAVIIAGALYKNRWQRSARWLLWRQTAKLQMLPVWLVSSGPLNESAAERDIAPTPQVQKLVRRVNARGHVTFGGRLHPDARGFPARAMAKRKAGDWRDPAHVQRWVATVMAELESSTA